MTRAQLLGNVHNISDTCTTSLKRAHIEYLKTLGGGETRYTIYPVVPAWGGTEVALGLYYNTFLIYRTCMRRAPARPVFFWNCCAAVQEHDLRGAWPRCNAQSTSQYYFVLLQSLHKAWPSTTLHYKARKKDFLALPCTTGLAQSTSQYYFVLQSSQKECPCTALYYKACAKLGPVLLCTTKLAKRTS